MVNACPPQSDLRPKVAEFISNDDCKVLAGLVVEGLGPLLDVVIEELRRQQPESNIILMDRDLLSDEDITFPREFTAFIERELSEGKRLNLIVEGDIPVPGWNMELEKFKGKDLRVYYGVAACRQVPICSKVQF